LRILQVIVIIGLAKMKHLALDYLIISNLKKQIEKQNNL